MINGDDSSNAPLAPTAAQSATHGEEETQLTPASSRKLLNLPEELLSLIFVWAINSSKPEDVMPLMATLSVMCKQFKNALDSTGWQAAYQTRFPLFYQAPTNTNILSRTPQDCAPQILWPDSERAPSDWKEAAHHFQTTYPAIKQAVKRTFPYQSAYRFSEKVLALQIQLSTLSREPNIPLHALLGLDETTSTQDQLRYLVQQTALLSLARTLQLRNFLDRIYALACTLFVNREGQPDWEMEILALGDLCESLNQYGLTRLHWRILTDQGDALTDDIQKKILSGSSLLFLIAELGASHCSQTLLENAQIRQACIIEGLKDEDCNLNTALHEAAIFGHNNVIEVLLRDKDYRQACVRWGLKNGHGNTALHLAATNGYTDIVAVMLTYSDIASAMLSAQNTQGKTPAMLAEKIGHATVAKKLREAEAQLNTTESAAPTPVMRPQP